MAQYGTDKGPVNFPGVVTVRTTLPDPWQATNTNYLIPNGQKNPLGTAYFDNIPTQLTTTVTPAFVNVTNANGWQTKYRYVQYKGTATTAVKKCPALVFWADEAKTQVTSTMSESWTASTAAGSGNGQSSVAGWMMVNAGTNAGAGVGTGFTFAVLQPATAQGGYIWIAVAGYVGGAFVPASTAADDWMIGGATAWLPVRVAEGTTTGHKIAAYALTGLQNVSGAETQTADIFVLCESL